MKLLIVGARGQVGSFSKEQAFARGFEVLAVDREQLNVTDAKAVHQLVSQWRPQVIINAAAHTAVDKAESEKAASYAINRDGPANLAKAANEVGSILLHISTDYVFAGDKAGLYQEEDAVGPQGVYGASKLAGEQAVRTGCSRHLILRTAWVFGEHGTNFVKTMLRLGATRDSLGIVDDQFGGPTYAGDIAAALLWMAEQAMAPGFTQWGVYHFAGEPHVSWYEFANIIFQVAHEEGVLSRLPEVKGISTADYPTPARRPANSRLDCSKIRQVFGITPSDWLLALQNIKAYA